MMWLLNYSKWIYTALVVLGGVATLFSLWSVEVATGYFVLVLLGLVGGSRWLSHVASRGIEPFYAACDPEPMLENCDKLLAKAGEGRGTYLLTLRSNRSAALLALGRREEARQELERMEQLLPQRVTPVSVVWRWNRACLALEEERLQGMEGELEAIAAQAAKLRVPSIFAGMTFPELMTWYVEHGRCMLLLRTAGPVLTLLPRLRALLQSAPCLLCQVEAAMELAEYHLARGEEGLALPFLRLTAEKAPKLAIGARARNKLSHMGV